MTSLAMRRGVDMVKARRFGRPLAVCALFLALAVSDLACSANAGDRSPFNDAVVPGGAALTLEAGKPAICSQLVHSAGFRDLDVDMTELASASSAPHAVERLQAAAIELRSLARKATAALRADLAATASALDDLKARGIRDSSAVRAVSHALMRLGGEMQTRCEFPVG